MSDRRSESEAASREIAQQSAEKPRADAVTVSGRGRSRRRRSTAGLALATAVLAILVVITDHDVAGVTSAEASRAGDPAAGAKVFTSAGCTACHTFTPAKATGQIGPDLDKLSLTASAAASVITNGRRAMPSFRGRLSTTQISDVASYLLAGKGASSKPPAAKPVGGARSTLGARLTDTKLVLSPRTVPPGQVTVRARNAGKRPHTLVVMRVEPSPRFVAAVRSIRPAKLVTRVLRLRTGTYLLSSDRRGQVQGSTLALLRVRPLPGSATTAPEPGTETPAPGGGTAGGASGAASDPTNGARLFASLGCGGCHTFAPAGSTGTVGPNLGVTRPTASRVVSIVTSGSGVMPSFTGRATAKEILDIAAFVTSVGGGGGAGGGGTAVPSSSGAQVFASAGCGGCHTLAASGASGTIGPNLDILRPSLNQVIARVTAGGGVMPAFGGRLTTAQIQDVAVYVSSVAGTTAGGGSGGGTPTGAPGLLLYQRGGCGGCHRLAAAGSTGTKGPDLDDKHPDAGKVIEVVTRGKDEMPSFATVFSAAEIRELANWIESVVRDD